MLICLKGGTNIHVDLECQTIVIDNKKIRVFSSDVKAIPKTAFISNEDMLLPFELISGIAL